MSRKHVAWLLAGLLPLSAGCQSARVVSKSEEGGVIAIPANNDMWPFHYRTKAQELLARECPEGYVIELEEEYVTGQATSTNVEDKSRTQQITKNASVTLDSTQTNSTTSNVTEWRIHYRKKTPEDE